MKKICLVIPSLQTGGMERVMSELANYFAGEYPDLEIHLVLFGRDRKIFYWLSQNIIVHKPIFTFDNSKRFLSSLRTLWFLRKKIKTVNPATILSFGEYWNSFVLLALLGLPYPIFISDRCQPDKPMGRIQNGLRKILYPRARGIVAQTAKAKEIYADLFKNKNVTVIGNPVRKISSYSKHFERENIVLSVGRLIETKHYDKLIEMFLHINQSNWKLVIVGGDALKQLNMKRLKKQIERFDATDRVILTGRQSNVESYYLKSKIFAFTSSSEGFPNVIAEAFSAGLPVVAFDCIAGPSEMILDGKNGFLIPLFNFKKFENKLKLLMRDEVLRNRLAEYAKKSVDKLAVSDIGQQYYSFITKTK